MGQPLAAGHDHERAQPRAAQLEVRDGARAGHLSPAGAGRSGRAGGGLRRVPRPQRHPPRRRHRLPTLRRRARRPAGRADPRRAPGEDAGAETDPPRRAGPADRAPQGVRLRAPDGGQQPPRVRARRVRARQGARRARQLELPQRRRRPLGPWPRGYASRMSVTETRSVASIIDGRLHDGGTRVESRNPANLDEIVCEAWLAGADAFADACRAARAAQPGWAATPAPVRGKAIGRIGRLVEDNKEALARLLTREIGKPYPESLGEVQEVVDTCDFFVSEGRRLYGQTVPSELPDKQLFTFRNPVGVAAIITAGNFPVAVPSWY